MSARQKIAYLDDLEEHGEGGMEFRLTYQGRLLSGGQNDRKKDGTQKPSKLDNLHDIRAHFHQQLRRLWESTPFLNGVAAAGDVVLMSRDIQPPKAAELAIRHSHYGHQFVPLVSDQLKLRCELQVLFLRADMPDRTAWSGDIDNRIKTLLDALRIPEAKEDYSQRVLGPEMQPMYCLMEDDKLITKLDVETDQLLDFDPADRSVVALTITVRIRPYHVTFDNIDFV